MYDYEEACPVSKAASVLCERWTLQIIREMLLGASRFSELQKYLPKLSPTLLNSRLRMLEQQGLILKKKIPEKKGSEYQLTPSGQAILPILQELGKWGMRYAFDSMNPDELNISVLVRDFAVALNMDQLPGGDITVQFNVMSGDELARKFIMVRNRVAQVCDDNLGTEVDLYLTADLETYGRIWYGEITIVNAMQQGLLKVMGNNFLQNNLSKWLGTSQFAPFNQRCDLAGQA